jgi:SAM-dependent methyltransferase
MKNPVDLYDSHYGKAEADIYRAVRIETFGEDFGQMSWITAQECDEFCRWLGLRAGQSVLEVACGSGGTAVRIAEQFRVRVVGVDVNESAVLAATTRAQERSLQDRVEFQIADANDALPFPDESFDALFCNDAINHLRDRTRALSDWHRVLRPGGRCLYTDPIVITGCLSNAEIEARSSIGFFLFTPIGFNEAFIRAAGFQPVLTADVTANVSRTSQRWHRARSERREALRELEGETRFEELQRFLMTVHTLASEGRLSRFAFMCEKTARAAAGLKPGGLSTSGPLP